MYIYIYIYSNKQNIININFFNDDPYLQKELDFRILRKL